MNVNNVVAVDVYPVHEQIHSHTQAGEAEAPQGGEFREVPPPPSVREAMERYEEKHGTTKGRLPARPP
ncbi:hypothetical protein ABZ865_06595 [Streptomyces sp. NPDC047085]|uniref:hypothetical protein n=1 Tax=Streptomyces sp. NPDC047085 TaxID=3155140 RepID=UPI0033DE2141